VSSGPTLIFREERLRPALAKHMQEMRIRNSHDLADWIAADLQTLAYDGTAPEEEEKGETK